jgi:CHAD domain-containing protein
VPAAARVAFGGDQHVLAERGQVMAANRTAVRRGLAIRRATHRPPWGRRKTRGHGSIVPPLPTALVVVGVGVALALAKAQRERRAAVAAGQPRGDRRARRDRRRPSLRRDESFAEGLRRVILGQLDLTVELLEEYREDTDRSDAGVARRGGSQTDGAKVSGSQTAAAKVGGSRNGEQTVHETRKAIKRVRALLKLLRGELESGGDANRYARENDALRNCANRLAGARDAEVMLGTLEALLRDHPKRLARSAAVRKLRNQLLAERETAATHAIRDPRVRGEVLGELRAVRARVERWELRERGFKPIAPGLERIYRQGRSGLRGARRRGSVTALHNWRKRVKELRYAAEALDRGGKPFKSVRRIARRADRLGEMLGEEHDLALLERRLRKRSRHFAGERKTRKRLLRLIARRRKQLRRRALRDGERLYRRKPRRVVRRLKRIHA